MILRPIIDHINRYVGNVEDSIKFYQEVINYKLIDQGTKANGKQYAILRGDNHELFISEKEAYKENEEDNFRHLGYQVEKYRHSVK